ncbi:MAG: hypothetical protein IJG50_04640 [Clostridia bacterium]|nr:hypothetical protein [Clostridia bacterium]
MNNKALTCALLAVICAAAFLLNGCTAKNTLQSFADEAGVQLSNGNISQEDTHGGFHGDGTLLAVIRFDEPQSGIAENEKWKSLPLSDTLKTALYGFSDGSGQYMIMPLIDFESAGITQTVPHVENGYYYFEDRHSKSTNASDDTDLLARSSYNFTLALYDSDTDTMYVIIEDT